MASCSRMCTEENCGNYDYMLIKVGHQPRGGSWLLANNEVNNASCHSVSYLKSENYTLSNEKMHSMQNFNINLI